MDGRPRQTSNLPSAPASASASIQPPTQPPPSSAPPPPPLHAPAPSSAMPDFAAAVDSAAASTQHQALDNISASIQRSLALLHQLHCSVSSFTLTSQLTLLERMNGLMKELSVMHSAAEECHFQIPIDVIRFIDEGQNPDEFTKNLINNCIQRNQATKGKVDAFKALRKNLLEQISEVYPAETETYRALRTASALESRRLAQTPGLLSNGDVKVKAEHL